MDRVWIGQWIDGLSDAERDRIIEHPDPTYDGEWWWNEKRDCGCLVGCVVGKEELGFPGGIFIPYSPEWHIWVHVGYKFYDLTRRIGPERAWRIVKVRAAKRNAVNLTETPVEATV